MLGVEPGQVLAGKYRVERLLGQGGMGVVLAAHHLELEIKVALKLLLPQALVDHAAQARFLREARAAVRLKSEHVAQVLDVGRLEDGTPFIVMEYLEGVDLSKRVEELGVLPIADAVDFCAQACEAIAEAHKLGIVHRDLKPANLFLTRGFDGLPFVKVLDFGISKTEGSAPDGAVTSTAAMMGSPLYMSPEQMQSARDVDLRTDIWAVGAILFELISGKPPFGGESLAQVLLGIMQQPTPSLRAQRAEVPAGLEAVIGKCLEKDRGQRFDSVNSLLTALAPFGGPSARVSLERISRLGGTGAVSAPLPAPSAGTVRLEPSGTPSLDVARSEDAGPGGQTQNGWGGTRAPAATPPQTASRGRAGWLGAAALAVAMLGTGFVIHDRSARPGASASVLEPHPPAVVESAQAASAASQAPATSPPAPAAAEVAAASPRSAPVRPALSAALAATPMPAKAAAPKSALAAPAAVAPMAPPLPTTPPVTKPNKPRSDLFQDRE